MPFHKQLQQHTANELFLHNIMKTDEACSIGIMGLNDTVMCQTRQGKANCMMQDDTGKCRHGFEVGSHKSEASPSPLHCFFNIPHLTEAWCYGCNGTYWYRQVTTNIHFQTSCDFTTSSQKRVWVDHFYSTFQKHHLTYSILFQNNHSRNYCVRTKISEQLTWENNIQRNYTFNVIIHCVHGGFTGTRKK
jgi:hypothetical protein